MKFQLVVLLQTYIIFNSKIMVLRIQSFYFQAYHGCVYFTLSASEINYEISQSNDEKLGDFFLN